MLESQTPRTHCTHRAPDPPLDPTMSWVGEAVGLPDGARGSGSSAPAAMPAYRLVRRIGQGGMGEVWEGIQTTLDRVVAIKRIRADHVASARAEVLPWMISEFRNEALATGALEHPNIAPVHDYGLDESGLPLLVMKRVRGRNWSTMLYEDWMEMAEEEFLARHLPILIAMSQAVAYAHSRGIVHRDLKPAQMMIGEFGETLLMDWGLAIRVREVRPVVNPEVDLEAHLPTDLPTPATATNPTGTPAMMAPEQTSTRADGVGYHTDVFLLGSTLYFLLTGQYPFQFGDGQNAVLLASRSELVPPRERTPERMIPPALEELVLHAMHPRPEDRVASAQEFARRLQDYLGGSSRRRESEALTRLVEAWVEAGQTDFDGCNRALGQLEEARVLWPSNHRAETLRDTVHELAGKEALRRGDLGLAELHAGAIRHREWGDRLDQDVARARQRMRRQTSQRRIATLAAVGLGVLLVGGGVFYNTRLAEQRDQAEAARIAAEQARAEATAQRDRAAAARASAESLVLFMIGDLRERLAPRDPKLELLDKVSERAIRYYDEQDTTTLQGAELSAHLTGLNQLGLLLSGQARLEEARRTRQRAVDIATRALEANPNDLATLRHYADALSGLARALNHRDQRDRSLELLNVALSRISPAVDQHPTDLALRLSELDALNHLSQATYHARPVEEAFSVWDRLEKRLDEAEALGVKQAELAPVAMSYFSFRAISLERLGRLRESRTYYERAREKFRTLSSAGPVEPALIQVSGQNAYLFGKMLSRQGEVDTAGEVFQESLDALTALSLREPDNLSVRYQVGALREGVVGFLTAKGRFSEALEELERVESNYEFLIARDATNLSWPAERLIVLSNRVELLNKVGRSTEAAEFADQLIRQADALLAERAGDMTPILVALTVNSRLGGEALARGDHARALDLYLRTIAIYGTMPDAMKTPFHDFQRGNVLGTVSGIYSMLGDFESAAAKAIESADLYAATRVKAPEFDPRGDREHLQRLTAADCLLRLGRREEALDQVGRLEAAPTTPSESSGAPTVVAPQHLMIAETIHARAALLAGNEAEARQRAARAVEGLREAAIKPGAPPIMLRASAWAEWLGAGDAAAARARLDALPQPARDTDLLRLLDATAPTGS